MTQTDLLGNVYVDPGTKLTPRQRFALEFIRRTQPVSSEELGAALHEYRRAEGGRGHAATDRCRWCQVEGAHMGGSLRDHDRLVRYSRKYGGWVLGDWEERPSADASFGRIPF